MRRFASLALMVMACALSAGPSANPPAVSIIQLIANPEKYDRKVVTVIGFLKIRSEHPSLYLAQEDYKHSLDNNISVEPNPEMKANARQLDENYVLLVGTFIAYAPNPVRLGAGGLRSISTAMLWSETNYPRTLKYEDLWQKKQEH